MKKLISLLSILFISELATTSIIACNRNNNSGEKRSLEKYKINDNKIWFQIPHNGFEGEKLVSWLLWCNIFNTNDSSDSDYKEQLENFNNQEVWKYLKSNEITEQLELIHGTSNGKVELKNISINLTKDLIITTGTGKNKKEYILAKSSVKVDKLIIVFQD